MTYAELNEMALKAESGADWAEICRLEAEMLAKQKRDRIDRIQFKSAGARRQK